MKKLVSIVLALAMILMVGAAFASGDVTVQNPGAGKTYTYYKTPFEVTYDATDSSIVSTKYVAADPATDTFLAAIRNTSSDPASPFTVTPTTDPTVFNISATDEAAVRAWLVANISLLGSSVGTGTSLTSAADGFYLMTVTNASGATENATTFVIKGANITIIDKNQSIPGPDKEESVDGGTTWVYDGPYDDTITKPTASIGDTVNYKVEGTFPMYIGTDLVKKLTFTDNMSKGLTFDGTSSVALVINAGTANAQTITLDASHVSATTNTTTKVTTLSVILDTIDGSGNFLFQPENTYTLTYSAKINEEAIEVNELEANTVNLKYDAGSRTDIDAGSDTTKVKSYDATIVKVNGEDYLLNGATFKVSKGGTVLKFVQVSTGVYRLAKTADETGAVEEIAPNGAVLTIKGLENGTDYSVDEVQVPAGYNRITSAVAFTIENANLDATIESNQWTAGGIKVVNNQGTVLPSTGGIGTTIFYILGGLLVVGAAVILVARRKASN